MENSGFGEISVYNNDDKINQVREYLENNDISNAKTLLQEMLEANPENGQACFVMAQILETEGDYKQAASLYEKVFANEIPVDFYERLLTLIYVNA